MKIDMTKAELAITAGLSSQFLRDVLPQIALSGRSNVGKSSLINTLICRKALARVSGSPGKTITVNFYQIDRAFYLVDLPGYGFAKRTQEDKARWSALTDGYFTEENDRPKAVLQLVDLKVGPTADDLQMLSYLSAKEIPYAVVATKADKPNKTERNVMIEKMRKNPLLKDCPIIPFSALNKEGREDVIAAIFGLLSDC